MTTAKISSLFFSSVFFMTGADVKKDNLTQVVEGKDILFSTMAAAGGCRFSSFDVHFFFFFGVCVYWLHFGTFEPTKSTPCLKNLYL